MERALSKNDAVGERSPGAVKGSDESRLQSWTAQCAFYYTTLVESIDISTPRCLLPWAKFYGPNVAQVYITLSPRILEA